ncbi:MAG: hypothetical protein ACYSWW_27900 [Planctomycetota bacterium]|jgi:hypothetical protein
MRREKKISRAFYKHTESGQILVIEQRWDGAILGSCPAKEPLKDLDSYQCTDRNNIWVAENSNKLVRMGSEEQR